MVKLVRLHPNEARLAAALVLHLFLPCCSRFDNFRLHHFAFHQNFPQGCRSSHLGRSPLALGTLLAQALVEFLTRESARAHQNFAQAQRLLGKLLNELQVVGHLAVWWQDVQLAVVTAEGEDVFNLLLAGARMQRDFKAQVAALGIHFLRSGHGV